MFIRWIKMSGFLKMKSSVDGDAVDDSFCYVLVYVFSFEITYVLVYDKRGTEMECRYQRYPMKQKRYLHSQWEGVFL
jgi:hypothetical protein